MVKKNSVFLFLLLTGCSASFLSCSTTKYPSLQIPASTTPGSEVTNQKVVLSFEQVSHDLGIPPERLKYYSEQLANLLDSRMVNRELCSENSDDPSQFCLIYNDFKPDSEKSKRVREPRPAPVKSRNISSYQNFTYQKAVRAALRNRTKDLLKLSSKILETKSCPRNLSLASARVLEDLLPEQKVWATIEKLYEHGSECLTTKDSHYEIMHLRQALLRKVFNNHAGAKKSIELALKAEISDEKGRVLFWAGQFQESEKERDKYWNELTEKSPLTLHALQVWKAKGEDPFTFLSKKTEIEVTRDLAGPTQEISQSIHWIETLYLIDRPYAAERLASWVSTKADGALPINVVLYLSSLKSSKASPRNTIVFLTNQIVQNPNLLSIQTLKLLFPVPYYEAFSKYSDGIDTFLVLSVARQESAFNPSARSPANARGLLQVLPTTARYLERKSGTDLYDVDTNVRVGTKFLTRLIDRFASAELALAAYNAGPSRAVDWVKRYPTTDLNLLIDVIPFKETRNYVASILRNNYWYTRLYGLDPQYQAPEEAGRRESTVVKQIIASHTRKDTPSN